MEFYYKEPYQFYKDGLELDQIMSNCNVQPNNDLIITENMCQYSPRYRQYIVDNTKDILIICSHNHNEAAANINFIWNETEEFAVGINITWICSDGGRGVGSALMNKIKQILREMIKNHTMYPHDANGSYINLIPTSTSRGWYVNKHGFTCSNDGAEYCRFYIRNNNTLGYYRQKYLKYKTKYLRLKNKYLKEKN